MVKFSKSSQVAVSDSKARPTIKRTSGKHASRFLKKKRRVRGFKKIIIILLITVYYSYILAVSFSGFVKRAAQPCV
jgi:hypothetical protein